MNFTLTDKIHQKLAEKYGQANAAVPNFNLKKTKAKNIGNLKCYYDVINSKHPTSKVTLSLEQHQEKRQKIVISKINK